MHQIFRFYESYSPSVHAALLLGGPAVVAAYLTSWFSTGGILKTLTSCLLVHSATLISSTVIYRLSPFHPLARYPGPFLRRVSMLIPAYIATQGNLNVNIKTLHDRYGDVIRTGSWHASVALEWNLTNALVIGPNELHVRDPRIFSSLWSVPRGPSNYFCSQKSSSQHY